MRRRDFIKVIVGSATAWPLEAFAQQSERMRRIGVLVGGGLDADDLDMQARIEAFRQGLQQLGWTNAQNVQIDIRAGAGNADRIRR
jgi:putative ABC transport system substrate-binding protein